eukprot:GHVO01013083.1.p2 GENE.GHVO01013083.1~~GHVO01013083.1.p2  ORF type:complete len:140 (+),score=24.51 GHVO01013083.1:31-450(+)
MSQLAHPSLSWIFVGERSDAKDQKALNRKGIRYILNCTQTKVDGGVANFFERCSSYQYRRVEMFDHGSQSLTKVMEEAIAFMEMCRIREDGNILIHCNKGVSRSVSVVIMYMMKVCGLPYDDAMAEIRSVREQTSSINS